MAPRPLQSVTNLAGSRPTSSDLKRAKEDEKKKAFFLRGHELRIATARGEGLQQRQSTQHPKTPPRLLRRRPDAESLDDRLIKKVESLMLNDGKEEEENIKPSSPGPPPSLSPTIRHSIIKNRRSLLGSLPVDSKGRELPLDQPGPIPSLASSSSSSTKQRPKPATSAPERVASKSIEPPKRAPLSRISSNTSKVDLAHLEQLVEEEEDDDDVVFIGWTDQVIRRGDLKRMEAKD